MHYHLADRVARIKPSATLAVSAKAQQLQAQGHNIINLGVGEPDFDTPDHIKEAANKAMHDGKTKYTAVGGTPELKQAIVNKFARENQLTYTPNQILVSNGAKHCIFNLAQVLINPGDEVIIPAPYWVSYPDIVKCMNGEPVIISAGIEQHYKIKPHQLEAAITPKTRLLILNSPSNPTGMVYTQQELQALAEVLIEHPQIMIASDDIYEHILWSAEPFINIAMACEELNDRTIVINGVSKSYAMTGWRIGYCAGPEAIIAAMTKMQSQSTSNPCSIAQAATVAALSESQDCVKTMNKAFQQRHDFLIPQLQAIAGIHCLPSQGTFYSFPSITEAIKHTKTIHDDVDFANFLLDHQGLAIVPGSAFGMPGSIRLSFACSEATLADAIQRLQQGLSQLTR
ncbi:MAG: pyridoxal phosphate-dependent aminotransferase [Legionellales bacterium]|nr:pyridoxal phosphate-dependent aminotransferase [Legionellales bacterium]